MPTTETLHGTPAYPPFKTFTNALDALARNPLNRIDRTSFPGQSGGGINQLLIAFRFFGLITDEGKPTPALLSIAVADEAARKVAFRKLVDQKYAPLFALNLTQTTPGEFAEKLTEAYNVTGDTRLKAARFFLNALTYLGIPVSELLLKDRTKTIGNGSSGRKRRVDRQRTDDDDSGDDDGDDGDENKLPAAESRSVTLRSGGTLTLSATTKFMTLSPVDRKFVFELIDKLEEYETQGGFVSPSK